MDGQIERNACENLAEAIVDLLVPKGVFNKHTEATEIKNISYALREALLDKNLRPYSDIVNDTITGFLHRHEDKIFDRNFEVNGKLQDAIDYFTAQISSPYIESSTASVFVDHLAEYLQTKLSSLDEEFCSMPRVYFPLADAIADYAEELLQKAPSEDENFNDPYGQIPEFCTPLLANFLVRNNLCDDQSVATHEVNNWKLFDRTIDAWNIKDDNIERLRKKVFDAYEKLSTACDTQAGHNTQTEDLTADADKALIASFTRLMSTTLLFRETVEPFNLCTNDQSNLLEATAKALVKELPLKLGANDHDEKIKEAAVNAMESLRREILDDGNHDITIKTRCDRGIALLGNITGDSFQSKQFRNMLSQAITVNQKNFP